MRKLLEITDFTFEFTGYGHYLVTYKLKTTGKKYRATTNNMRLIDATKNCENPKMKDLLELKRICKR
jgi:hypothetical protein